MLIYVVTLLSQERLFCTSGAVTSSTILIIIPLKLFIADDAGQSVIIALGASPPICNSWGAVV